MNSNGSPKELADKAKQLAREYAHGFGYQSKLEMLDTTIDQLQAMAEAQPEEERLRAEQAAAVMPLIGPLLDAWEAARGVHEFRDECPELHKMLRAIDNAMEGRATQAQPEGPLHIGACLTDGKLHASVMRREANGNVTCVAMAEIVEAELRRHDCFAQMVAAPTTGKREPLTPGQIEAARPDMVEPAAFSAGVRFAEKRHGITGEQQ
jgi:hypothetical protein